LLNDSLHNSLISKNASITFELGSVAGTAQNYSQPTINITLPYASFDLTATYPFIGQNTGNQSASSWYFPLKQAANSTQYTLGRTFLQEAYLIVDYGRANFSISQTAFLGASSLVGISSPGSEATPSPSQSQGLSAAAIAGIAIGIPAVVGIIAATIWCYIRKRKGTVGTIAEDHAVRTEAVRPVEKEAGFLHMGYKAELPTDNPILPQELESPDTSAEHKTSPHPSELAGSPQLSSELASDRITSWQSGTTAVTYELPGDGRLSPELVVAKPKGLGLIEEQGNE